MINKLIIVLCFLTLASLASVQAHVSDDTSDPYVRKRFNGPEINILEPRNHLGNSRLPNDTRPVHYDVRLSTAVHTGDRVFNGTTIIEIDVMQPTNEIVLHVYQMTILRVQVRLGTSLVAGITFALEIESEFLRISSTFMMNPGRYFVEVEHTGLLRLDDGGFYLSSYVNAAGVTRYLGTTQFQDIDARHAFPCYDEPGIRAPISLRITHDQSYTAISTMPPASRVAETGGNVVTTFETTPSMQAYILAFIISDFTSVSNAQGLLPNQLLQRIYARPAFIARGDAAYGLNASVSLMPVMEGIVQRQYPLPKMDQAAIPTFAAGAMENYGLCTYRESILLYNPDTQPMAQRKLVSSIISHEFAHQFFGNAVSPTWWTYIWLSEGFATLYEYYLTHFTFPEYGLDELYVAEVLHFSMDRDNTLTIRPMSYYAEGRVDIFALFDVIAYDKASTVLRTLMYSLGLNTFNKGLNYYLAEMNDRAVIPLDLSRNLERAAREDNAIPSTVFMHDILTSWSDQSGYPILHVSRGTNNVVTLRQERFFNVDVNETMRNQMWWLPYNFASSQFPDFEGTRPDNWMTSAQSVVTMTSPAHGKSWTVNDWMVFNKQQTSYYRVNYDTTLWHLIIDELVDGDFNRIHFKNRAQLLDDAFKLAKINRLTYDIVFELVNYMDKEQRYLPWAVFNSNFAEIDLYMSGHSSYNLLRNFIRDRIEPFYNRLGATSRVNDQLLDRYGRNIAINYACRMGLQQCLTETTSRLTNMLDTNNEIEIDVRSQVYCNGLRNANTDLFLRVWNRFLATTNDEALRNLIGTALGCSELTGNLNVLLGTTIDRTTNYMPNDRQRLLSAAFGNTNIGLQTTLTFIENNFQMIHDMYDGAMPLNNIYAQLGARIVTQEQLNRYRTLGERLVPIYVNLGTYNTGLNNARNNLVFVEENNDLIADWIDLYIERTRGGANSISLSSFGLITAIIVFLYSYLN